MTGYSCATCGLLTLPQLQKTFFKNPFVDIFQVEFEVRSMFYSHMNSIPLERGENADFSDINLIHMELTLSFFNFLKNP